MKEKKCDLKQIVDSWFQFKMRKMERNHES